MSSDVPSVSTLTAIRAAHHAEVTPSYDRVVFEFRGPVPQFNLRYVAQLLADGSGLPVQLPGKAILQISFSPAIAHTEQGESTAPNRVKFALQSVREVVGAGDFEGIVTYGIGLAQKEEIAVLTLADPSRVVIDVIHSRSR